MALFNYATKEITLKIVYYGPGLSGKTTNLQYLHSSLLSPETKGKLLSLATEADRTLFFDFFPVEIRKIRDFSIRFQLYTVPGQVRYNATRKIVLKGADAVIFVADSQREMRENNIESFENMMENLHSNNINPDEIPIILQYNKRDLKYILSIDELNSDLNPDNHYFFKEAIATNGTGVEDSYNFVTEHLLENISKKHKIEIQSPHKKEDKQEPKIEEQPQIPSADPVFEPSSPEPAPSLMIKIPEKVELVSEYKAEESSTVDYLNDIEKENPFEEKVKVEQADVKEPGETAVIPIERTNIIINELEKISGILSDLKNSVSIFTKEAQVMTEIEEVYRKRTDSTLTKEMNLIKELKEEQKETNLLLHKIINIFDKLKTKKSWFSF